MAKKKTSQKMKMKAYASFDLWFEDQETSLKPIIKIIRKLVQSKFSKLTESVKWGNGVWLYKDLPVIYLYGGYKDYLQLGFFAGAMMKDPKGLLQGNGKHIRAICLFDKKEIDQEYFAKLMRQAIKIKYR